MNSTTANSPLVEIVIAAHNPGDHLLESVRSALRQTYRNIRVTVVDDGCTDGSIDVLNGLPRQPRLRVLQQAQSGKSVALNHALAECDGEFFAIQDADDVSHPKRIELLVAAMAAHQQCAAVFSGHELIRNGRHLAPVARGKTPAQVRNDIEAMRLPAHDPTAMFRLSMINELAFEPALQIGQGFDHILRVGERFPMIVIDRCLYGYRLHRSSNTQRQVNRRIDFVLRVIERACHRRGLDRQQTAQRLSAEINRLHRCGPLNNVAAHFMNSVLDLRDAGHRKAALRTAIHAIPLAPLDLRHYKPLAYAIAPRPYIRAWRRRKHGAGALPDRTTTSGVIIEPKPDVRASSESPMIQDSAKVASNV